MHPRSYRLDVAALDFPGASSWSGELLRRFSSPSPYSNGLPASASPDPGVAEGRSISSHEHPNESHPLANPVHEITCEHTYSLKSRGKDYAFIVIRSRATKGRDRPLYYDGDDVVGTLRLPVANLEGAQKIEVVLQEFDPGKVEAAAETIRKLKPADINPALIEHGHVMWPFHLTPDFIHKRMDLSSPVSHDYKDNWKAIRCQLVVTIYRRGRLTQNAVLVQPVEYIASPEPHSTSPVLDSSPDSVGAIAVPIRRAPESWEEVTSPTLSIKGTLFHRDQVDVHCTLVYPAFYPASTAIPLKMTIASTSQQAIDLLAGSPSSTIDVRLFKIVAYGEDAARMSRFSLIHRSSYHTLTLVANARWHVDGNIAQLASDPFRRWKVHLHGELCAVSGQEIKPSVQFRDLLIGYTVHLFPFKASDFQPNVASEKDIFIAPIPLT